MTTVRLVATDLDGTLLRADETISERTRRAIAAAHAAGVHVVAATGRGWRSALPMLEPVPEITTAVCSNGALIHDIGLRESTDVFAFPAELGQRLVDTVLGTVPDAGLAWELAEGGFGYDHAYAGIRPEVTERYPDLLGEVPAIDDAMLKLLVRHPHLDEPSLLAVLTPVVPDDVHATSSGFGIVEITGAGVHKAHALGVLCGRLGIDASEVVALGDNRNDVEMLRWAGRGVAMGNAVPAAVQAADEQTADHMDDGVAIVIEDVVAGLR
jgi:Cof subfamily protein (haloacid dehalogenase superfamily)